MPNVRQEQTNGEVGMMKKRFIKITEWGEANWGNNFHVFFLILGCLFVFATMISSYIHMIFSTLKFDTHSAIWISIIGFSLIVLWYLISISFIIIDKKTTTRKYK